MSRPKASELDYFSSNLLPDVQHTIGHFSGRKSPSCTPRIEPEDSVLDNVLRLMAMPVNDNLDPSELRSYSSLQSARCSALGGMVDANFDPARFDRFDIRKLSSNIRSINVPVDASEKSKLSKPVDQALSSKISRVHDQIHPRQVINELLR